MGSPGERRLKVPTFYRLPRKKFSLTLLKNRTPKAKLLATRRLTRNHSRDWSLNFRGQSPRMIFVSPQGTEDSGLILGRWPTVLFRHLRVRGNRDRPLLLTGPHPFPSLRSWTTHSTLHTETFLMSSLLEGLVTIISLPGFNPFI